MAELLAGLVRPPEVRKARLEVERELASIRRAAESGRPDDRDELAVALLRLGQLEDAVALMREVLTAEPGRARTLHNLAVALLRAGKHAEALLVLDDLDRAAPGYAHGLSAGLRAMAEFRRAQALRPDWSQRNLLTPELTAMWNERLEAGEKLPDRRAGRRRVDAHVPGIQSLVEVLRRFPEFGDGWAALGVLHEVQGDMYTALKCYRMAVMRGTGLRAVLESHMRLIEPVAQSQDPARLIGPRALWTLGGLLVMVLLFSGWKFLRAVREDVRTWRQDPDRVRKKGSYGPLGDKPLD
jgi:tetratricopeptide (TPR) repeat protein